MRKQVENKVCSRGISFFGRIIFDNFSLTCFSFILRFKQIHLYSANFQIRLSQERVSQRNSFTFDLRLILNHRISQISFLPRAITRHPEYTGCIVICESRSKSGQDAKKKKQWKNSYERAFYLTLFHRHFCVPIIRNCLSSQKILEMTTIHLCHLTYVWNF